MHHRVQIVFVCEKSKQILKGQKIIDCAPKSKYLKTLLSGSPVHQKTKIAGKFESVPVHTPKIVRS